MAWYCGKRKRPIAHSTVATGHTLILMHEDNPQATVNDLKAIATDKTKMVYFPDAIAVLDAYINAGAGESIPNWR